VPHEPSSGNQLKLHTSLGDHDLSPATHLETLDAVYSRRFLTEEERRHDEIWREVAGFLQRYVPEDARVLDLGCDRGDFIRNIRAAERWAVDLRDVSRGLTPDIHFRAANGLQLDDHFAPGFFGVVFMSNYLEHLPSTYSVIEQLQVVSRLLAPGGRVIVLQPNIRLIGSKYWDFIDHRVPLTERSLGEAGQLAGYRQEEMIVRFLPFTTKSRIPQDHRLVRMYLKFPLIWRLMGKQTLYVGRKPGGPAGPPTVASTEELAATRSE
jgi:SAM-dependent methyltransferase